MFSPEAAGKDTEQALKEAREIGQAATLMYALFHTSFTHICCGNYAAASAEANELVPPGRRKRFLVLGGARNAGPRLRLGVHWRRPVEWTAAMGQFAIHFGARFPGTARS
jgi:hypothetical protein